LGKKSILNNPIKLKIGDLIELGDLVGEKYKQTKAYNLNIEKPIEIFKYDENEFKFVELLPSKGTNTDELPKQLIVHKLLSKFHDTIKFLELSNNKLIATTNFFKIEINKAIESNEIKIIKNRIEGIKQEQEIELIKEIQERYELYSLGMITIEELNYSLEDKNYFYFQILQNKWKTNYIRSITGKFYKKKEQGD